MARRPTLEALLKFLTADMQSAFLAAIQGVVDQVILNEVVEAVIAGDADRAFELLGFNPGALRHNQKGNVWHLIQHIWPA